jgi:SAM-dependent methyltransferase
MVQSGGHLGTYFLNHLASVFFLPVNTHRDAHAPDPRAGSSPSPASRDAIVAHNAKAWDALVRQGAPLAQPATNADFSEPLEMLDAAGWLGDVRGLRILCLAAGGGRQSALYAAAGAIVTVVDVSGEMLAADRRMAAERGYQVRLVETSMDDLSMFGAGEFDAVVQPVSTCYVPDVQPVFLEAARVTRLGGLYISQHKSPVSLQTTLHPNARGKYELADKYYRTGPLPPAEPSALRERGALEFLHRWEELIGGMCRAGFVIEDLLEPAHAMPQATAGSFAHRAQYVAPYVRVKARRGGGESSRRAPLVV